MPKRTCFKLGDQCCCNESGVLILNFINDIYILLLLYSAELHQHTDDNVPGTDVAMPRVRGV